MMKNRVKRMIRQGQVAIGTIVRGIGSPNLMWMLAAAGFDFVYIDAEHSCFSIETIGELIMAARGAAIVPIVRPPAIEPSFLSRCLDAGALGVLIPHVETVEQIGLVVKACKYAPEGQRGISTRQVQADYQDLKDMKSINEEIMIEIMVESRAAVERVKELAAVPGVDAVIVGQSDLAQDLGVGGERDHRLVIENADRVIEICSALGVAVGLHTFDLEEAREWLAKGVRMLGYSSDVAMVVDVNSRVLRDLRAFVAGSQDPT